LFVSEGGDQGPAALAASRAAAAGAAAASGGFGMLDGIEAYAQVLQEAVTLPLQVRGTFSISLGIDEVSNQAL